MFKAFQKNIITQIILLLCLVVFSFVGLHVSHNILTKRQDYLQMLLGNEQVKMELSHILQKKILAINVKLHDMANAASIAELERTMTFLSALESELMEVMGVIDQGGTKHINNLANFGFEDGVSIDLKYIKFGQQHINIEILELKAKIIELQAMTEEFQAIVEQKISIVEDQDLIQVAGIIRKVSNYYKGIEPLFKRILKNSYFLHSQSLQEMKRIQTINNQFSQAYQRIENTSKTVTLVLILLMGALVLRSSQKILRQRQQYQQELLDSNENLEDLIQKRTLALKNEVADRKAAEIKIKDQTDFLRKVIESLSYPFSVIDAQDYSIVLANSAALAQGDGTQMTCYALIHQRGIPCDNVEIPCPLQIMKKTRRAVVLERVHRHKHGENTYSEVHGYPIFDEKDNLVQMIEYSLDITEKRSAETALQLNNSQLERKVKERTSALEEQILQRKEAELTLIKSEQHYRRLIENTSDIVTIIDSDGVISYTSASVKKIIGLSPSSIIGHNIRELLHPDEVTNMEIESLFKGRSETGMLEYRTATRDGQYRVLESHIQKFQQDDNTDAYILNSRDITARKNAEEEMHKLRMVVEQSPSSIVITDFDGRIEYVNPAFEQITGYSYAEAVGQNPRVLKSGHTPKSAFKQLWKTITAGKIWRGEFINKKKSGELYSENVLVIPIKNVRGEITNFVAVKENITELKRARKHAEQANQAKSNFLSQMSHELRTPLNAINGFSQLMLKSKKNPLNEKQSDMVGQIHTAGQHLLQLINEVLDLARIESGEFSLSIEPLDLHVVLDQCLSLTDPLAQEKSITITNLCAERDLPLVRSDLTRLKQVLLNLISNAVKYNHPQGIVSIDAEIEPPGFLRFIVADNGFGMPEEKQKDLFTPFTRMVENPDDIEGTGIGMTISKQLVEKMGGDLGFESQLGEGSRFWFTLPISGVKQILESAIDSVEKKKSVITSEKSVQPKLVLYVEDNPLNVAFMQDFFSELEDLRLVIATTGEEGVAMALKHSPNLILMDLNLPGIDGFQAYRQIKANPKTEFIPVVVVSADAMEKTVKRIHKMGFDGYVAKPVDVDLLRKTIADIFEG